MASDYEAPAPCGAKRRAARARSHTKFLAAVLLSLIAPSAAAASASADAANAATSTIVAADTTTTTTQASAVMLGYQEGARRRARCVDSPSSLESTQKAPHLRGLDLHFLPAMGGGGGAYADPFLAGVAPRCSSGLARAEYDPPGLAPGADARAVFGQDLRSRADAARAAAEAAGAAFGGGGALVRSALCPPGAGVSAVAWRPARPSGDAKEDGQPLRVGGVTVYCRAVGGAEEEAEGEAEAEAAVVVVDPAPEASAPPPHTQRTRLGCARDGDSEGRGRVVSELDMWHDDVFNGLSVAGCV